MFRVRLVAFGFLLVSASYAAMPAFAQDAVSGEKVFRTQCMACHSAVAGRKGVGPNLFGIVGCPAGTDVPP